MDNTRNSAAGGRRHVQQRTTNRRPLLPPFLNGQQRLLQLFQLLLERRQLQLQRTDQCPFCTKFTEEYVELGRGGRGLLCELLQRGQDPLNRVHSRCSRTGQRTHARAGGQLGVGPELLQHQIRRGPEWTTRRVRLRRVFAMLVHETSLVALKRGTRQRAVGRDYP